MRFDHRFIPDSDESAHAMPVSITALQRLYDACKATFAGTRGPFSAQGISRVRSLLDNIKPSDVGLDETAPLQDETNAPILNGRRGRVPPPISYLHIYECEDFSMGIFCLPASAVIPLHNHPGMTVLSKLLYGKMHVRAYDWVDNSDASNPRLAKLEVDRVMNAPCEPAVLYPTSGGNMHVFTAITPCAVLDVLAPPYSPRDGRHCTYYRAHPHDNRSESDGGDDVTEQSDQELAWLEEFQPPDSFVVKAALYNGPRLSY